jgi:hypothetical protein
MNQLIWTCKMRVIFWFSIFCQFLLLIFKKKIRIFDFFLVFSKTSQYPNFFSKSGQRMIKNPKTNFPLKKILRKQKIRFLTWFSGPNSWLFYLFVKYLNIHRRYFWNLEFDSSTQNNKKIWYFVIWTFYFNLNIFRFWVFSWSRLVGELYVWLKRLIYAYSILLLIETKILKIGGLRLYLSKLGRFFTKNFQTIKKSKKF